MGRPVAWSLGPAWTRTPALRLPVCAHPQINKSARCGAAFYHILSLCPVNADGNTSFVRFHSFPNVRVFRCVINEKGRSCRTVCQAVILFYLSPPVNRKVRKCMEIKNGGSCGDKIVKGDHAVFPAAPPSCSWAAGRKRWVHGCAGLSGAGRALSTRPEGAPPAPPAPSHPCGIRGSTLP